MSTRYYCIAEWLLFVYCMHVCELHCYCSNNAFDTAKQTHYKLYSLMNTLLSISSNPIPVKAILAYLGKVQDELRLPLCSLDSGKKHTLIKIYKDYFNG